VNQYEAGYQHLKGTEIPDPAPPPVPEAAPRQCTARGCHRPPVLEPGGALCRQHTDQLRADVDAAGAANPVFGDGPGAVYAPGERETRPPETRRRPSAGDPPPRWGLPHTEIVDDRRCLPPRCRHAGGLVTKDLFVAGDNHMYMVVAVNPAPQDCGILAISMADGQIHEFFCDDFVTPII
jgi:hypothetical protein